jgi:hypothetical protein
MDRKLFPFVAAFLILVVVLGATPFIYAASSTAMGPKLEVTTIPQDDQVRGTGVMILGIDPEDPATPKDPLPYDLMSQHKLLVTYNGATVTWALGTVGVAITCNVLEKDTVPPTVDPKTNTGQQFPHEELLTKLTDVSDKFVCKPRWKSPASGTVESSGVLDVYFVGPLPSAPVTSDDSTQASPGLSGDDVKVWIADYVLVVEATMAIGRTVIFGTDIQDICVLGWAVDQITGFPFPAGTPFTITKPDGTPHYVWQNALGPWPGCDGLVLAELELLSGMAITT